MPKQVRDAIMVIWAMIGVSVVAALLDRLTGSMHSSDFALALVVYGFMVMFPYKLSKASNPARYVWAVFSVIGILIMIGEPNAGHGKISNLISYATTPIGILTIFWLFSNESNRWFKKASIPRYQQPPTKF